MNVDPLATPCLLYCGSCRYYIAEKCLGCGKMLKGVGYAGCPILKCCRTDRKLRFCSERDEFPYQRLKESKTLHLDWLEDQAKIPNKK